MEKWRSSYAHIVKRFSVARITLFNTRGDALCASKPELEELNEMKPAS